MSPVTARVSTTYNRRRPVRSSGSSAAIRVGSSTTTQSYSRPLAVVAGTTLTRMLSGSAFSSAGASSSLPCGPSTECSIPASRSSSAAVGTSESGTINPIEPSSSRQRRTAVSTSGHRCAADSLVTICRLPGESRTDVGAFSPGAMLGSSLAAYRITASGTRNPRSSSSITAPLCPRCSSVTSHEGVAQGVVPCAMSPSTVIEPVEQRRPTARSCIGERSCASSSTTCPILAERRVRSVSSSSSTASAELHFAEPAVREGFSHSSSFCSSAVRMPSACRASTSGSENNECRSFFGSTVGHTESAYFFTSRLRATESCTRSSGESPASSIRTSTACAIRCGSMSLAAE